MKKKKKRYCKGYVNGKMYGLEVSGCKNSAGGSGGIAEAILKIKVQGKG